MLSHLPTSPILPIAKIATAFSIGIFIGFILAGIGFLAGFIIGDNIVNHSFRIGGNSWWTTFFSFTKTEHEITAGVGGLAFLAILGAGILNSVMAIFFERKKSSKHNESTMI